MKRLNYETNCRKFVLYKNAPCLVQMLFSRLNNFDPNQKSNPQIRIKVKNIIRTKKMKGKLFTSSEFLTSVTFGLSGCTT